MVCRASLPDRLVFEATQKEPLEALRNQEISLTVVSHAYSQLYSRRWTLRSGGRVLILAFPCSCARSETTISGGQERGFSIPFRVRGPA